jgi:hypothetical protein
MVNSSTSTRVAAPRGGTSGRFYACVAILLVVAVSMQATSGFLGTHFRKAALPLKRPLDLLDQSKLLPEYAPHRYQPELLSREAVDNLGTEEYLNWNLADRLCADGDPTAVARLLVTYHTGGPGLVPHRPQECLSAAGMTLRDETRVEITVPGDAGVPQAIPVSVLEFELPRRRRAGPLGEARDDARLIVAYFFYVNGRYVTTRTSVRRAVSNPWDRYAYYSKVEVSFGDDAFERFADEEQTIEATARLLRKLMPILWDDHYQDWEAIKSGVPPVIPE